MTRLVAFGCSNTYGDGLEDCWDGKKEGPNPSKFAWPNVLGSMLGVDEVINAAKPAISNKQIWLNAMEFDYRNDDIVFLHWTFIDRDCFFDKVPVIGPWKANEKTIKLYYKNFYSEKDRHYDFYNRADHVDRYLKSKNIKQYHFHTPGRSNEGSSNIKKLQEPTWFDVDIMPFNMRRVPNGDTALDNMHPGPKTHKNFASLVFDYLKEVK